MISVEDFKKLKTFADNGYQITCDGEVVYALGYCNDGELFSETDGCTFCFASDRYGVVYYLSDYLDSKWEVRKTELIDWRNQGAVMQGM